MPQFSVSFLAERLEVNHDYYCVLVLGAQGKMMFVVLLARIGGQIS